MNTKLGKILQKEEKALEIVNCTGGSVDLSSYTLKKQTNGTDSWSGTPLALSGTLANGDVYVIANASAGSAILDEADLIPSSAVVSFNGNDPIGLFKDDILIESDELHLKTNRPVKILLRSVDVLHNYYVPQFRAKMDAIPGIISYYWFEPNKIGEYEVLCAEYCGVGHYAMRATVIVEDENNYNNWRNEQETFSNLIAKQKKIELEKTKIAKK